MKKIALCGTPEIAIPFFDSILNDPRFDVAFVIIKKANKYDRKKNLVLSPVEIWARGKNLKCVEYSELNIEMLQDLESVLIFAFGKIISKSVLQAPKMGWLNLHPSDLPLLRGPSPLQFSILNNFTQSALTLIKLNEFMDEGDIIAKQPFTIDPDDDIAKLIEKISKFTSFVNEKIHQYLSDEIKPQPQTGQATYCSFIKPDMHNTDKDSCEVQYAKLRALNWIYLKEYHVKCFKAKLENKQFIPLIVQTSKGKKVSYKDFLNGV